VEKTSLPLAEQLVMLLVSRVTAPVSAIALPQVMSAPVVKVTVVRSKFLLAEGILQNQDGVIHIKATRLTALVDSAMELRSHDFH